MQLTTIYPPNFEPSTDEFLYIEEVAELIAQAQGVHIFEALAELCTSTI